MLPPELNGFLGMLGVHYPNINEEEIKKDAAAWRIVNAGAQPAAVEADTSVRRTQQAYRGESATALTSHWNKVGGDGGHLAQAAAAAKYAPVLLDGTASIVSAVKVVTGTQAAAALAFVLKALAVGGVAGVTAAYARMKLTRGAIGGAQRAGGDAVNNEIRRLLAKYVSDPMHRVSAGLKRPMGPGSPALAAGPRGGIPLRPSGLRNPSGPRSLKDGIVQMGRNNRRNNNRGNGRGGDDGGRRRGGGFFSQNSNNGSRHDGRIHGDPLNSARGMTEKQAKEAQAKLEKSIKARKREEERKGYEVGHAERIRREEKALRELKDSIRRKQYDADVPPTSSSSGTYNGGSQASADRYPTDAEWEQQKKTRRW
ncbi:hypothetical protein [Nonomuraea basaltis]|uniref:WXG100-like domain-containing protein n=1 Tax=Nonomuraea basaltis TaxID=2495887 RepID=UPI00110C433E|nr:hypothetical protein [Nonomuraea basaltis]TMR98698.1 hypothetical protein EJK15_11210 [Nonomuraea basaltis]